MEVPTWQFALDLNGGAYMLLKLIPYAYAIPTIAQPKNFFFLFRKIRNLYPRSCHQVTYHRYNSTLNAMINLALARGHMHRSECRVLVRVASSSY